MTSSFWCVSTCQLPNHLCHLSDLPRADSPGSGCQHNTHCSKPHPCSRGLGKASDVAAISGSDNWRLPRTPTLLSRNCLGFKTERAGCKQQEGGEGARLLLTPLVTGQVCGICRDQENKTKTLAREMRVCLLTVRRGRASLISRPCSRVSRE